jgi:hypothetical protein
MKPCLCLVPVTVLLLAACGGSDSAPEQTAGPCAIFAAEPVLAVSSARDSATSAAIAEVLLSDVVVDGLTLDSQTLLLGRSSNIRAVGSGIACTLPCALSTIPGKYTFTASANGYQASKVSVEATYANSTASSGGCPTVLSGPRTVSLTLSM